MKVPDFIDSDDDSIVQPNHLLAKNCDPDILNDSDIEDDLTKNQSAIESKRKSERHDVLRQLVSDKDVRQRQHESHVTNNITYNINNTGPTFNFNSCGAMSTANSLGYHSMGSVFNSNERTPFANNGNLSPTMHQRSHFYKSMEEASNLLRHLMEQDDRHLNWVSHYIKAYNIKRKHGYDALRRTGFDDTAARWVANQRYQTTDPNKLRLLDILKE